MKDIEKPKIARIAQYAIATVLVAGLSVAVDFAVSKLISKIVKSARKNC